MNVEFLLSLILFKILCRHLNAGCLSSHVLYFTNLDCKNFFVTITQNITDGIKTTTTIRKLIDQLSVNH